MLKNEDYQDRLVQSLATCRLHYQRMQYAVTRTDKLFPVTLSEYEKFDDETISFTDQLIYRFSKLQDTLGNKLFPLLLEGLYEDIENLAFIDILSKIEKLGLIDNSKQWLLLRETRNVVTHEYPFQLELLTEGLNQLKEQLVVIGSIWADTERFIKERLLEESSSE